jgi:hypothetical protein
MTQHYALQTNLSECGYCTQIYRTDYDSEVWHLSGIARELLSDQPLQQQLVDFSLYINYEHAPECKGKPLVDYFSVGTHHIISQELKAIFENQRIKAEYFPVDIFNYDGEKSYYLVHFLDMVDCLDHEKSTDTNRPYEANYNVTAIRDEKIPDDILLFREKSKWKSKVFIHNSLKTIIEQAGIKGIIFLSLPEDGWETGKLIDKLERECKKML